MTSPFAESSDRGWLARPESIVSTLLPAGMTALEAEDRSLALAFAQCPVKPDVSQAEHDEFDVAHGLSYQVYEHVLQYELLKAWLPFARVDWDVRYDKRSDATKLLDLCVHHRNEAFAFELKWWGNGSARLAEALSKDVERLANHATARERYLLAFWYGSPDRWEEEAADAKRHSLAGTTVYVSRFRTKGPLRGYLAGERHFAMAAIRVEPTTTRSM